MWIRFVICLLSLRQRRDKEHSTIIYESGEPDLPLLRLGWNKQDPRYLATLVMDTAKAGPPGGGMLGTALQSRPAACRIWGWLRGVRV